MSSARSNTSAVSTGRGAGAARADDGMGDWVSYIDEATGQEYWYNSATGETSWA